MRRALRRIAFGLMVSLLIVAGAGFYLLDGAVAPETSDFAIDIEKVRALARGTLNPLPVRLNSLVIAERTAPSIAVVAHSGLTPRRMVRSAFQIMYPGGEHIIIDTALDRTLHEANGGGGDGARFEDEHFDELQVSLVGAQSILFTHEHPDHIGGLARSPHLAKILPRVHFLREQLDNRTELDRAGFPSEFVSQLEPLDFEALFRPAPGLALLKAPGHTPGSQMIYLTLYGGLEFLFVGDIAWHMDNVTQLRGRPRLVSRHILGEDRPAVLAQLRALHDLVESEPDLHLIVAHDAEQLGEHIAAGLIGHGFQ